MRLNGLGRIPTIHYMPVNRIDEHAHRINRSQVLYMIRRHPEYRKCPKRIHPVRLEKAYDEIAVISIVRYFVATTILEKLNLDHKIKFVR